MADVNLCADAEVLTVNDLLRHLRTGGRLVCGDTTLQLHEAVGPGMLMGVNAHGMPYFGCLSRRYVGWWRGQMIAGEVVGTVASHRAPVANAALSSPTEADDWTRLSIASQLVALLDAPYFDAGKLMAINEALNLLGRHKLHDEWNIKTHPGYPGLMALNFVYYRSMGAEIAERLPAVTLATLGWQARDISALLGDSAELVNERYERGVWKRTQQTPEMEGLIAAAPQAVWKELFRGSAGPAPA